MSEADPLDSFRMTTAHYALVHPHAQPPMYATAGAAGCDLAACEAVVVRRGLRSVIPTGVVLKPPPDHFTLLALRSSMGKRGLVLMNGVGIIDADYCGADDTIQFVVFAPHEDVSIAVGDRIGQAVFLPMAQARLLPFVPAGTSRGGFGSSGQ